MPTDSPSRDPHGRSCVLALVPPAATTRYQGALELFERNHIHSYEDFLKARRSRLEVARALLEGELPMNAAANEALEAQARELQRVVDLAHAREDLQQRSAVKQRQDAALQEQIDALQATAAEERQRACAARRAELQEASRQERNSAETRAYDAALRELREAHAADMAGAAAELAAVQVELVIVQAVRLSLLSSLSSSSSSSLSSSSSSSLSSASSLRAITTCALLLLLVVNLQRVQDGLLAAAGLCVPRLLSRLRACVCVYVCTRWVVARAGRKCRAWRLRTKRGWTRWRRRRRPPRRRPLQSPRCPSDRMLTRA